MRTSSPKQPLEKIQKVLAHQGVGSRRAVEQMIEQGLVRVNQQPAHIGQKISLHDLVQVRGRKIHFKAKHTDKPTMLMYFKPEGEICSTVSEPGKKSVFQQLPKPPFGRWVMIGRLDVNTSGLLLFTNSGEVANRYMHPKYEVPREYIVRVLGDVKGSDLEELQTGIMLEDGMARFEKITLINGASANKLYKVVLKEGRNREVRRLFEAKGFQVSRLKRISFGDYHLPKDLKKGKWKFL